MPLKNAFLKECHVEANKKQVIAFNFFSSLCLGNYVTSMELP